MVLQTLTRSSTWVFYVSIYLSITIKADKTFESYRFFNRTIFDIYSAGSPLKNYISYVMSLEKYSDCMFVLSEF